MRTVNTILMAFVLAVVLPSLASAQQCGEPPRVDDQSLRGDLEGKAKLLSSLVGDANLQGRIEIAKTDIFSKYPNADKLRSSTYLLYVFCTTVLADPKYDPNQRFQAIITMQNTLNQNPLKQ